MGAHWLDDEPAELVEQTEQAEQKEHPATPEPAATSLVHPSILLFSFADSAEKKLSWIHAFVERNASAWDAIEWYDPTYEDASGTSVTALAGVPARMLDRLISPSDLCDLLSTTESRRLIVLDNQADLFRDSRTPGLVGWRDIKQLLCLGRHLRCTVVLTTDNVERVPPAIKVNLDGVVCVTHSRITRQQSRQLWRLVDSNGNVARTAEQFHMLLTLLLTWDAVCIGLAENVVRDMLQVSVAV